MQNAAAALDFQHTARYNKVYFDPEGGIFLNRMLGYLKGYERESVLAPLFKMLEATFDPVSYTHLLARAKATTFVVEHSTLTPPPAEPLVQEPEAK